MEHKKHRNNINQRMKFTLGMMMVMLLYVGSSYCYPHNPKILTITQKMTEISEMHEKVSQNIACLRQLREELKALRATFIDEISDLAKRFNISSYKDAIDVPRIQHNLKLIQQLEGYIQALSEKMIYLNNGKEKFVFYYQQAKDDLKIIETLNDMNVEQLIQSIDKTLDLYAPETKIHIIDADQIDFRPLPKVWHEIW